MGWWENPAGVWGDEPADIMDEALDRIRTCFEDYWNRQPTADELRRGLLFSMPDHGPREPVSAP